MKELKTRIITATVILAVFFLAQYFAAQLPFFLTLLTMLAWGAALFEFLRIVRTTISSQASYAALIFGVVSGIAALFINSSLLSFATLAPNASLLLIVFSFVVIVLAAGRSRSLQEASNAVFLSGLGIALFGLSGISLLSIVLHPTQNSALSLWLVGLVAVTDIAAYTFGKLIGGPKLAPIISPGKTVSGALGATAVTVFFAPWLAQLVGVSAPHLQSFAVALMLTCAAQTGDLLQSLIKRIANVKDSGTLLPGHGGVFDRIDGLLAAAAIFYFLMY